MRSWPVTLVPGHPALGTSSSPEQAISAYLGKAPCTISSVRVTRQRHVTAQMVPFCSAHHLRRVPLSDLICSTRYRHCAGMHMPYSAELVHGRSCVGCARLFLVPRGHYKTPYHQENILMRAFWRALCTNGPPMMVSAYVWHRTPSKMLRGHRPGAACRTCSKIFHYGVKHTHHSHYLPSRWVPEAAVGTMIGSNILRGYRM